MKNATTLNYAKELMKRYTFANLAGISKEEFLHGLAPFLKNRYPPQGPERESTDFTDIYGWAINHDFGDGFVLTGTARDRHIKIFQCFLDNNCLLPLQGKCVFVVGPQGGGDILLLKAYGASHMTGIEEHPIYCQVCDYLCSSFGLDTLMRNMSVYDTRYRNKFDVVYCAGVIYHVTDIILLMRILYNSLKDGGECYIETALARHVADGMVLEYEGPVKLGWNWHIPTPQSVLQIGKDVMFDEAKFLGELHIPDRRGCFYFRKHQHRKMKMWQGISNHDVIM